MNLALTARVCLVALAAVTFLGKSYDSSLRGIDSNIHAAVSMSVTSGPGLAPRLPIPIKNFAVAGTAPEGSTLDPNRNFNDHPFFIFWLNGLIMRALGPSATSARLLTGLFSLGSVWVTLEIGTQLVAPAFGYLAALLLIFCRDFILTSATVSLDTALVFFILLSFYFWLRRRWIALGIAAGVGLWVKTPLVLLVFPVALLTLLADTFADARKTPENKLTLFKKIFPRLFGAGVLAVSVGSLLWIYAGLSGGWSSVEDYWVRQLWGTAVGGRGAQAQGWDWGRFFIYNLRTGFLPGLPFLIVGLIQIARKNKWREPSVAVPLTAVLVVGLVVTALRFKLGHYFTPIFPFLALLAAHSFGGWASDAAHPRREQGLYQVVSVFTPVLLAALLVWPVSLGPEAFVALRRFVPMIQTNGHCEDVIALVPGGEPVGSDLDYSLFLTFYTGRTVESVGCAAISARLESAMRPAWVIISDPNLKQCVKASALAHYPARWRVGTQLLLSRLVPGSDVFDLTPQELNFQAVTDCRAPAYPQDVWHHYL